MCRGGCSPIGMKHSFKTTIDASAKNLEKVYISGGRENANYHSCE